MLFILVKPVLKIGNPKLRAPLQPQSWDWNHTYDEAFYEAHREEVCFNPPRKFSHYVGNWWGFGALIVAHESQKSICSPILHRMRRHKVIWMAVFKKE